MDKVDQTKNAKKGNKRISEDIHKIIFKKKNT